MNDPKPPSWEEISRVFERVAEAAPARRREMLDELCAGDGALRREVESLLAAEQSSPDLFLEDADLLGFVEAPRSLEEVGLRSGGTFAGYEILELVAEGGMGAVFRARQETPSREVALKALRPGLASESLLKRFDQEVRVLGNLEHEGIARIHDAGVQDGVPFFVMEFVHGVSVTADARGKSREERIDVFLRICGAVQFAHERGVVHRDLKPANILVDERGAPRVLDFGVARVTDGELRAITQSTIAGQLVGTLAYMSPEQAAGARDAVDARADVYALGVILYELLAGRRPLAVDDTTIPEAVRMICDRDPTLLGEIDPSLKGDLETIAAKALEKEPARRYASAAALADDLRRSLEHRPIHARPPSTMDQLRKFARRNRALVAGVDATIVTLTIGVIVAANLAIIAGDERDRAEEATEETRDALYRTSLTAAIDALKAGDSLGAKALLDEAPEDRRGFEYDYVDAQLDESVAALEGAWRPIEWLPDDETLLLAGGEGLMLWTPGGSAEGEVWATDAPVGAADVSDDGRLVAAAAGDVLHVWRVDDGAPQISVAFEEEVRFVEFAPGETVLAVAVGDVVSLVDATTGRVDERVIRHTALAARSRFSPDGRWLVALSVRAATFHDRTGEIADRVVTFAREHKRPRCAFHQGHERLTIGGYSHALETFDLSTGERVAGDERVRQWTIARWLLDEARSRFVVTNSLNGGFRLLDADSYEVIDEESYSSYRPTSLSLSSSGRLAAGLEDFTIRLFEPPRALIGHESIIDRLIWNANGTRLASGAVTERTVARRGWFASEAGPGHVPAGVRVWDPAASRDSGARVLRGHESWLSGLEFSPDGQWLATSGYDRTVRLWEVESGDEFAVVPYPRASIWGGVFSADASSLLIDGTKDGVISLVDGGVEKLDRGREAIRTWVADHRGEDFVTLGRNGALGPRGLEVRTSADQRGFELHVPPASPVAFERPTDTAQSESGKVGGVTFRPDGERFAVAYRDGSVRVWETSTRRQLAVMRANASRGHGLAYSPCGTRIASGHLDGAIRIWDADRFVLLVVLRGHEGYVHGVAFSPDGRTLASVSGDHTVRLWETRTRRERVTRAAAARARRDALRPRVLGLFEELGDAHAVKARLDADSSFSAEQRRAAQAEILREALRRAE